MDNSNYWSDPENINIIGTLRAITDCESYANENYVKNLGDFSRWLYIHYPHVVSALKFGWFNGFKDD